MTKTYEQQLTDYYAAQEQNAADPERVLDRMGGFAPDVGLERQIVSRDRDPAAFKELDDRNPGTGLVYELAIYETGRDAAIATGRFDPAAYRRENGLEPGRSASAPATGRKETPDATD